MIAGHTKLEERAFQQARVRRIMKSLQSIWRSIRRRGREEFRLLSEDERRQLLLTLFQQYQRKIIFKALPGLLLLSCIASGVLLFLSPLGLPCLLLTFVLAGGSCFSWHDVQAAGANLLALSPDNQDVALVPFLLDFARRRGDLPGFYQERLEIVGMYLRQLLPRLSPQDTQNWTLEQREALTDILSAPFEDFDLTIAVLRVIAFAGTRSALARVRFLAGLPEYRISATVRKSRRENKKNAEWIRQAAQTCLPMLAERHSSLEAPATLLRSSVQSPEEEAKQLLRVAQNPCATEEKELLRPRLSEKEEAAEQTILPLSRYDTAAGQPAESSEQGIIRSNV
jgi:hypothetical protein